MRIKLTEEVSKQAKLGWVGGVSCFSLPVIKVNSDPFPELGILIIIISLNHLEEQQNLQT